MSCSVIRYRWRAMKLKACERCGKRTAEGLTLCPDCMKESGAAAEAVAAAVRTAEAVGADAQTRANAQGANAATTGNGVRRLPKIPGSQSLRRHLPITTTPPGAAKAIVGRVTANTAIAGAGTVAAAISLRAAKPRSRAVACPGSSPCGIHRERRHAGCRAEGFPNRQQP